MTPTVQLYLGDCLEFMRGLPAGAVDAVVTDPPYGIGEVSARNNSRSKVVSARNYGEYSWDKERASRAVFIEIVRVSEHQIIFGGNYYSDFLPPSSSWIVWNKLNSGDFADCELAWTSHKRAVRKIDYLWNGMFKKYPEDRVHPTQKPLYVMTWIIRNYTPPGCIVFDPFMGSGTTGVAAVQLGRNFIGCEIDPGYFAIAKRRIEQAQAQPPLLPIEPVPAPDQLELPE